jgi:hypothetical protein
VEAALAAQEEEPDTGTIFGYDDGETRAGWTRV